MPTLVTVVEGGLVVVLSAGVLNAEKWFWEAGHCRRQSNLQGDCSPQKQWQDALVFPDSEECLVEALVDPCNVDNAKMTNHGCW
eukprot:15351885-Ditylum_brightwellii.AAC.1